MAQSKYLCFVSSLHEEISVSLVCVGEVFGEFFGLGLGAGVGLLVGNCVVVFFVGRGAGLSVGGEVNFGFGKTETHHGTNPRDKSLLPRCI